MLFRQEQVHVSTGQLFGNFFPALLMGRLRFEHVLATPSLWN
jgi:hypothetical protein